MQKVVGSSPIARSNDPSDLMAYLARYPSGKGEVCKTSIRRFDSDRRLHPPLTTRRPWSPPLTPGRLDISFGANLMEEGRHGYRARVQSILLKPKEEWVKIKVEPTTIPGLFISYADSGGHPGRLPVPRERSRRQAVAAGRSFPAGRSAGPSAMPSSFTSYRWSPFIFSPWSSTRWPRRSPRPKYDPAP